MAYSFADQTFDLLASHLVDDVEYLLQRFAGRVGAHPAGELFGVRIQECDTALDIRCDYRVADAGQRSLEPVVLASEFHFHPPSPGNVLDGQQNQICLVTAIVQPPGVEQHRARTDVGKIVLDLVIVEFAVGWQKLIEQSSQGWNVPLTLAKFID